ncbi:MAG: DUF6580 family putative transport protein [Patescibacteria group bacterium]
MSKNKKIFLILFSVIFVMIARLIPHLPNFAPITALALMAGVYFGKKWAIILPLAGLLISDFFVGFYGLPLMLMVYGSFAAIGISSWWLRKNKTAVNVFVVTMLASVFFFLTTNLAVWAFSPWYSKNPAGLLYCFELAIPFFRNALMGNLAYVGVMFGCMELTSALIRRRQVVH